MTTKQSLTLKLSAAQVKMLTYLATSPVNGKSYISNQATFTALDTRDLVEMGFDKYGDRLYKITDLGLEALRALNNIQPVAPVTETAESAPVIADSAPKMGDTVTGENARGNLVTGKVTAIGCKVVTGVKYVHVMAGSTTHEIAIENVLPGKMPAAPVESDVMDEDTAPVIVTKHDLYQAMKEAEEVYIRYMRLDTWDLPADHITYQRKVRAHINYLRASAAFTGMNNEYLIAYLYGVKNALPASDTGVSSAPLASEVLPITDDAKEQEVTVSPVLEGSTADDFIPVSTDTYTHPMRLIQKGSAAYNLPTEAAVKAKREQQYAEVYERIHGKPFVRKAMGGGA